MGRKVSIVIERDVHGFYAYSPELPGCHTQAPTLDEAVERIKEAIELYLDWNLECACTNSKFQIHNFKLRSRKRFARLKPSRSVPDRLHAPFRIA